MPTTNTTDYYHVISLDPEGERYRAFASRNGHLGRLNIFRAIRGTDIPREERVSSGLLTPELFAAGTVTEGTLGCAASHRALWRAVAAAKTGAVIMEDDVFTHPGLPEFLAANPKLLRQAEIVFFGVNTDSVLANASPQGLTSFEILAPRHPDSAWIKQAFASTHVSEVKIHRLINGFGLCCYWVSPHGAAKLLQTCFPLTSEGADVPLMPEKWPGSAIDGRMNAFLPTMAAFITRPFLAYSPNTDSSTSV